MTNAKPVVPDVIPAEAPMPPEVPTPPEAPMPPEAQAPVPKTKARRRVKRKAASGFDAYLIGQITAEVEGFAGAAPSTFNTKVALLEVDRAARFGTDGATGAVTVTIEGIEGKASPRQSGLGAQRQALRNWAAAARRATLRAGAA